MPWPTPPSELGLMLGRLLERSEQTLDRLDRSRPVAAAWRRLCRLETRYDRRIAVALLVAAAYLSAWSVLRLV